MNKIIAIINQKGGVGKTTSAINIAAGLGLLACKVLLVDLDPQSNATTGLGINRSNIKVDMFDILIENKEAASAILPSKEQNVWIIPSSIQLAGADLYLNQIKIKENKQIEYTLKNALLSLKDRFDYILIDCPPSLGLLNQNALTASDSVIIPIQTEYYALEGLAQLLSTIKYVKKFFNPKLEIEGVLLTMVTHYGLSREVEAEVKKYLEEKVYASKIPRNIKLAEAPSFGEAIFNYDNRSVGAQAYLRVAQEVINNGNK